MMNVNFSAVAAAAVVGWLVGAVWYVALSRPWLQAQGKTKEELMGSLRQLPGALHVSFLAELVMALVLAVFVAGLGPVTVVGKVATAFLAWTGFVATSMVVNHRFGGALRCSP